jgi:tetratricopeptide (TPR) repeat protein
LIVALLGLAIFILITERQAKARLAADHFRAFVSRMDLAQYSEARLEIEKAVRLAPGDAYYASSFGLLEERLTGYSFDPMLHLANEPHIDERAKQHVKEAIRWYEKALDLNRNDGSFHHNLGWLLCLLNQNEAALEHFSKALLLEPNNAIYRISLGLVCERSGMTEVALSEYSLALRLSPGIVDSRFFMDFKQRLPQSAEEAVVRAINDLEARQTSDPVLKARLGKLYLHRDRPEAMETLKQVTVELPNLPRPWLHLGILYERQFEYEEAKRCYDRAVFLGGDYSALLQLARLHDGAHRTDDAIRYYQSAINSWRSKASERARNAPRIYQATSTVADNIVPRGFLSYVEPDFDLSAICVRAANLHRANGNAEQASYYDDLGKRSSLRPASLR